jgi:hypothetical protein
MIILIIHIFKIYSLMPSFSTIGGKHSKTFRTIWGNRRAKPAMHSDHGEHMGTIHHNGKK